MSEEIVGVIYPVPSNLVNRILKEGKDVFIKHPTCFKQLKPGHKVLFYASQEVRGIVGEATIRNIDFLKISEIYERYGDRVFISREEAKSYSKPLSSRRAGVGGSRDVKFLVLELQDIKKYGRVVKPKRFITVGGKYLTKREYEEIKGKAF
ncbi:MAG: DUF365 domain-containing protein [Candidatus Baldrarchaeia archaeon]